MKQILKINIGSKLYGTNTADSDTDFGGVFIPDEVYVFGMSSIKETTNNKIAINESKRNTSDAIDDKSYELRHFINLLRNNNPNILEMIFVNKENILFIDEIGQLLLNHYYLFPSMSATYKFISYSNSQLHKMQGKQERNESVLAAHDYLGNYLNSESEKYKYLWEMKDLSLPFWKYENGRFIIGEINCQPEWTPNHLYNVLDDRIKAMSSRLDLVSKYGFDTKFGSHMIRLKYELIELLKTGVITFPLKEASIIKDIKLGLYTKEEVINSNNELTLEIDSLVASNKLLPKDSDHKLINQLCIKLMKMGLGYL